MDHYPSIKAVPAFYHASPRYHRPGTLLLPREPPRRNCPAGGAWVYLTDARSVHHSIELLADDGDWYVYQVRRLGKLYQGIFFDLVCKRAEVKACVGFTHDFFGTSSVSVRDLGFPPARMGRVYIGP